MVTHYVTFVSKLINMRAIPYWVFENSMLCTIYPIAIYSNISIDFIKPLQSILVRNSASMFMFFLDETVPECS